MFDYSGPIFIFSLIRLILLKEYLQSFNHRESCSSTFLVMINMNMIIFSHLVCITKAPAILFASAVLLFEDCVRRRTCQERSFKHNLSCLSIVFILRSCCIMLFINNNISTTKYACRKALGSESLNIIYLSIMHITV